MVAIRPRRQSIQHMSFRLGATISGFIEQMRDWQCANIAACTFVFEDTNIIRAEPGDDRIAALHRAHNHVTCPKCQVILDELVSLPFEKAPRATEFQRAVPPPTPFDDIPF